jgi:23S rRNA pseudouridine2605 synthase
VPKTYRARVAGGPVGEAALGALRGGVELDDGPTAPAEVALLAPDELELTIHEGRNRQVRRMCEAVGHPVLELTRVAFGTLRLGDLAPGEHRRLSPREIAGLGRGL